MKKGFTKRMLAFVIALAVVAATFAIPTESSAAAKKKVVVKGAVSNTIVIAKKKSATLKLVNESNKAIKNTDCKFAVTTAKGKKVVKVTSKGKVTAKKVGTAKIKITNKKTKASTTLTVVVPKTAVKSIKLNKTKLTLNNSTKTATLKVTMNPKKPTCSIVSYTSSNAKIAKVDAKGKVTAVAPGTATITVKALDQTKKAKAVKCTVTVTKATKVALNKTAETIGVGGTVTLKATVTPAKYFGKVTWKSSNTKVATVKNGKVTGVAAGDATITATVTGGKKATFKVTVKDSTVKLDKDKLALKAGETATLTATIDPANTTATIKGWTSSDPKIAAVDKDGKVTAVANGSATIAVELTNGKKATCEVTIAPVVVPATKVTAKLDKTEIKANETAKITVEVEPKDTTDTVEYVYDKNVISIDKDGNVTVVGTVTGSKAIKVTAKANDKASAEVEITIVGTKNAVEGKTSDGYTITLDNKSAESYAIKDVKEDVSYVVEKANVIADGKTFANEIYKLTAGDNNAEALATAIGNTISESKSITGNVALTYDKATKTIKITSKNLSGAVTHEKSMKLVPSGNAMQVICGNKEFNITDIEFSGTATNTSRSIQCKIDGRKVTLIVRKDGTSIVARDMNGGGTEFMSFNVTDDSVVVKVIAGYYGSILNKIGMSDVLADTITIENDYNKVTK